LLRHGEIAAARLLLRRAAGAGHAQAALKLGMTFDPAFLTKWGVLGIAADEAQAREWYDRAMALGGANDAGTAARLRPGGQD
jgi:TPR repeat protein